MRAYIIRRLLLLIPTLWIVSVIVFSAGPVPAGRRPGPDRVAVRSHEHADRPRGVHAHAGIGRAGARAVWTLDGGHPPARHPRQVAVRRLCGGGAHPGQPAGDPAARGDLAGDSAGDCAAGRHLLGDAPGYGRRLRGPHHRRDRPGHAQLLAGHHGDDLPGNLVGLVAADGVGSVRQGPGREYRHVHHSQPDPGHGAVRDHHAHDAHHDAGGAAPGLRQDRLVQGSEGAGGGGAPTRSRMHSSRSSR